jgi:hypothetical protein
MLKGPPMLKLAQLWELSQTLDLMAIPTHRLWSCFIHLITVRHCIQHDPWIISSYSILPQYMFPTWWFQPLWKRLVSWYYYSQLYGKTKNVPNHQSVPMCCWVSINSLTNQINNLWIYLSSYPPQTNIDPGMRRALDDVPLKICYVHCLC